MDNTVEIMSPAGSMAALTAAIQAGANSVYFGVEVLNMRAKAAFNFKLSEINKVVKYCHKNQVKAYLTVNIVLYDNEIIVMKKIMDNAKKAHIDAVICADMAAIQYANEIGLDVHISTQANVSNIEAVKFYAKFANVIVLARELNLAQITKIHNTIIKENICGPQGKPIKIEMFAHGALCIAISGKCYMSLSTYNSSANRGACLQNCRKAYRVIDDETGNELKIDNEFVMSPKDLCTIEILDRIIKAGVSVLKLEGRGRSPDYVSAVTSAYREAATSVTKNSFSKTKVKKWLAQIDQVYHRGLWKGGYYLGEKTDMWSGSYGSQSSKENIFLGRAQKYFVKNQIGEFQIETGKLEVGEEILITGATTGALKLKVTSIFLDEKSVTSAGKGDIITIPTGTRIRKNDKLFVVRDRKNPTT